MIKLALISLQLMVLSCYAGAGVNTKPVFDKELSQFKYPFTVETYKLKTQDQNLSMRYMDVGAKGSGKVVVLLHGKNFAGFYWERIANDLVKRGYRVIIPDQIGFGKSSKPSRYQFSFTQLALNTKALLSELKITNFTVVGHSMGGMLAVNMSYLFSKSVNKLILINPIGLETYLDFVKYKDTGFFFKNEQKKTVAKIRNYQKKNYYDGKWSDDYEALLMPFKGWLNGKEWKQVAWNNALTYSPIFSEDIVTKFPKLKNETYLIIGTRDRTGPGRKWKKDGVTYKLGQYQNLGKAAHSKIKNSKLFELEGLGHMPQFEDYKRFSKVFYSILK
ncbi:alpha/beta hydrolase [Halobacteriovorax marinus]|uniref:Alpha/beta hydrolase n=1 Tax=Halobacteriovorax marinus TaxID=97084 RepID=A0A1Y5F576_9BACT|nr:alpha/beta hydrolase [Halobacteriovorax marinus]